MAASFVPVKLPIQHVREHRQGMPIRGMSIHEGINNRLIFYTGFYLIISCNVNIIIVIDKSKVLHLPVNSKVQQNQDQNYNNFLLIIGNGIN